MVVYLLHFRTRINPCSPCQHYVGYADDLFRRLAEHQTGRGARLTQVAKERGIDFECVRVWSGDRKFERKIKNRKNHRLLCPICSKTIKIVGF